MPTDAQTLANSRNAQASTGPRTPAGRIRASLNAVRHGLYAETAVLPGEDRAAFDDLCAHVEDALAPANEMERILVHRIAVLLWRQQRNLAAERFVYARHGADTEARMTMLAAPLDTPAHANAGGVEEEEQVRYLLMLGTAIQSGKTESPLQRIARWEAHLEASLRRTHKLLTDLRALRPRPASRARALDSAK